MLNTLHRKVMRRLKPSSAWFAPTLEVGGRRFVTPMIGGVMCEGPDSWMVELLTRALPRKPGMFVDVGVNLGQTLLAVKGVDPGRSYVGFEPNPQCVAYVERMATLNGLSDCLVAPVGVGDRDELSRLQLYTLSSTDSLASLVEDFRPDQPVFAEKVVAVLSYASISAAMPLNGVSVVKIDVEGGEASVLTALRDVVARERPWLIVEILPCYDVSNLDRLQRQRSIEAMMAALEYRTLRILKSPLKSGVAGLQPVDEIGIHGEINWCDYLFLPREVDPGDLAA